MWAQICVDKYIKMMQASITPGMESVVNKVLSDARATTLKNSHGCHRVDK